MSVILVCTTSGTVQLKSKQERILVGCVPRFSGHLGAGAGVST